VSEARELRPGEILCISREEVERLLTPEACFDRCLDTFRWVGEGSVDQANPVNLFVDDRSQPEPEFGHGVVQAFPSLVRPLDRAAVKWLSSFRGNPKRGLPAISAINLLTDSATGIPLAIMDGTSVTSLRTGGHAAVGARYLARTDSAILAIVGCGQEGRTHLRLLDHLFDLEEIRVFDVADDRRSAFISEMEHVTEAALVPTGSVEEAAAGADIVCVVTTASTPVLMEAWVDAGAHVCAATGFLDVDPRCARDFDKWAVGWYGRDLEWIEGPETGKLGGLTPGELSRDNVYADLATEILPGRKPGRERPDERTLMTHLGMPALDAAVSSLVYDLAREAGAGTILALG
jgi:ornithine cyclodeaminase/alanine dehydrogenase-like protein (mu-crystallin family)